MVQTMGRWFVVAMVTAGVVGISRADEVSELRQQLQEQYNSLREIQQKLIEIETAQKQQGESVKKLESAGPAAVPDALKWMENLRFYGDFRYRHEQIDGENVNQRDRHRIRARVGLKAKINEEWNFDLRLASGSDEATSSNQDLDGGFSSKDFWLDRAYLTFKPASIQGLSVLAGKMSNPFLTVGGNQLMWDSDLNPEGIAVKYTATLSESVGMFVNGGGMWVEERSSDTDTSLWGIQGGLDYALADNSTLTGGAGYFKYGNIQGKPAIGAFLGNTSQGGLYAYDYELVELFGEYASTLGDVPVSLYGDYVVNTASGVNGDTAWLVGATYNKASAPGDWQIGYEYRDIERDAVLGRFNDSDFIGGGTHGKGHKFNFTYALAKNVTTGATYFLNDRDATGDGRRDDTYRRLQLDVVLKF